MGPVALTVRDLEQAQRFYERVLGLADVGADPGRVRLGAPAGEVLVELVGEPDAPRRPPRTTGLFHLAILVPGRVDLARALGRLVEARWPLAGASDHLVSEALYLADPEGNGIEVYRDRPPEQWRRRGVDIEMATLPLDLPRLMAELDDGQASVDERGEAHAPGALPAAARIGHVHLNVADIELAERFYGDLLGFDVTVRGYPGALFLAAGGYHHHVGVNTWAGAGAPAPPDGSAGLRDFAVELADAGELHAVVDRLRDGGVEVGEGESAATAVDPSSNRVVLRAA